jgi:serine palmitoyltransferase
LPNDLVDLRTAVLSKAVGGLGGVVFGASRFEDAVRTRFEHLYERGQESVSPSTIVQTLYVLGQPQRIRRQIYRLRDITIFCKEELRRLGVHVYGNATTPMLPVHAGRPSMACKLSYKLRQLGLLATPITIPAVKFWESRVRVTPSADFSDDQVSKLLDCIVETSNCVGISKKAKLQRRIYTYAGCDFDGDNEEEEHRTCVNNILTLIQRDTTLQRRQNSVSKEAFEKKCERRSHPSRTHFTRKIWPGILRIALGQRDLSAAP